jgi:hypothetical protein
MCDTDGETVVNKEVDDSVSMLGDIGSRKVVNGSNFVVHLKS